MLAGLWHLIVLALVVAGVAVLAVTEIGAPTTSARTAKEVVTAADGVVQSTVTGTGNVEAGTDVAANFQTSGTLSQILVKVGQGSRPPRRPDPRAERSCARVGPCTRSACGL